MSTQTAATRVQLAIRSLSASWPSDPLRPTLQFADAIKAASDRIVPSKLSKVELDKAEQTLASLERLAANSAKLQYPLTNKTLDPASFPRQYSRLREAMAKAERGENQKPGLLTRWFRWSH